MELLICLQIYKSQQQKDSMFSKRVYLKNTLCITKISCVISKSKKIWNHLLLFRMIFIKKLISRPVYYSLSSLFAFIFYFFNSFLITIKTVKVVKLHTILIFIFINILQLLLSSPLVVVPLKKNYTIIACKSCR